MTNEERTTLMCEGYTEAFIWAERPEPDRDETFQDLGFTVHDLNADAALSVRDDCAVFLDLIDSAGVVLDDSAWWQAGADLYFTRQGHGVGFLDRPDVYGGKANAARLDRLVEDFFNQAYGWVENGSIAVEAYRRTYINMEER